MPNGDEITYVLMSEIDVNGVVLKVKDAEAQSAIALNNIAISSRINDLNTRLEAIENPSYSYANVQVDWNESDVTSYSYIQNKPDLSNFLTQETQPDWEEDDTTNAAYIQNKPDLSHFIITETQSNWNETNTSSAAYIQNKPDLSVYLTQETQSDWSVTDASSAAYIQNKPDLSVYLTQETQSDWSVTDASSAAYIQNKPTIPTVSSVVTENDINAVSGGAVYAKFEDLIGGAPAALDTLQEIATSLNNDADLAGTLTTQISSKIPKVSNPTTNNVASFNSDGTIKDSGVSAASFITTETQPDWEKDDTTSAAYIQNKPTIKDELSDEYEMSSDSNDDLFLAAGDTYEEAFAKLEKEIIDNELITATALTDLNERMNNQHSELSSEYEMSSASNSDLALESGDTYEEAFGKLEKTIYDNEYVISSALTDLNNKIEDIPTYDTTNKLSADFIEDGTTNKVINVKPDWNATTGSAAEILNKPTIPTTSTTVIENDTNPVSGGAVYTKFENLIGAAPAALDTLQEIATALNNDADLAGTLTTQISAKIPKVSNPTTDNFASFNSDGTVKDSGVSASSFITTETQPDWEEDDTTSAAYIQNKPTIKDELSSEYERSTDSNDDLYLDAGDTYEEAFGKLEKAIIDNELVSASALNDLNSKVTTLETSVNEDIVTLYDTIDNLPEPVKPNWEAAAGSDAEILNKPTIPTVNDTTVTLTMNNTTVGTFTLNKNTNTTIDLGTVLTAHQSIKTVNNESLVGSGNVVISGLPQVSASDNGKILMVVNGQWQLVSPSALYSGQGVPNNSQGNNGDLYIQTD